MSSVNKVIIVGCERYQSGESIPQVADDLGVPRSTLRYHLKINKMLRTRAQGVRMAAHQGRLGGGLRGKARTFSKSHCESISKSRKAWADAGNAAGLSVKPNGYIEHTRGPHKGRSVHVVKMEERLGRKLMKDECVHHIDADKTNNESNNLALVTRSGHTRLHRREQRISKGIE